MVPRFFLCLFLEEKSLFACGIWGCFRVISGLRVAKVLQIFWPLYPLCHKGLQLFRQSRLLQIFLDGFLAECPPDLLSSLLLPIFTIIVGINTQRHVHRAVSSQILNLLYVQSSFKKTGDVSVAENMGAVKAEHRISQQVYFQDIRLGPITSRTAYCSASAAEYPPGRRGGPAETPVSPAGWSWTKTPWRR